MTLHERLQTVFQNVFNDDEIELHNSTTAADIDDWDSVMHINLMFAIEQEFGVQFAGNEFSGFASIGELEAWLTQRTGGQAAA